MQQGELDAMEKRIGVIAVLVEDPRAVPQVNDVLSRFGEIIMGRLGLPYRDRGVGIISLIVEGTNDSVGALSGQLGMISGVRTKSLLLTK